MKTATIIILGFPLKIRYQVHLGKYIEWYIDSNEPTTNENDSILETLLRVNHSEYVESKIRELEYFHDYAQSAGYEDPQILF